MKKREGEAQAGSVWRSLSPLSRTSHLGHVSAHSPRTRYMRLSLSSGGLEQLTQAHLSTRHQTPPTSPDSTEHAVQSFTHIYNQLIFNISYLYSIEQQVSSQYTTGPTSELLNSGLADPDGVMGADTAAGRQL